MSDTPENDIAIKQAIEWLVQQETQPFDAVQQHAFETWLIQCASHQHAWQRVTRAQEMFQGIEMSSSESLHTLTRAKSSRRGVLKSIAAISVSSWLAWHFQKELGVSALIADHHSAVGEQLNIDSWYSAHVQLNTQSAIDIKQDAVFLKYGEVKLQCNSAITVFSTHCVLNARAGDEFVLLDDHNRIQITAINRTIQVAAFSKYLSIEKGHTLTMSSDLISQVQKTPPHILSWSKGMLSVSQMPLNEFVPLLSRYINGAVRLDPQLNDLTISGSFSLAKPQAILRQLEQTFSHLKVTGLRSLWQVITIK